MDSVRQVIEAIRGNIAVHNRPGQGCTVELRLPLTLSIIQAVIVRAGDQWFAVPSDDVILCQNLDPSELAVAGGRRLMRDQGRLVPVVSLREALNLPPSAEDQEAARQRTGSGRVTLLRIRLGERRFALEVDQISAHREIVVKGLGKLLQGHPCFSGSTVTGSGMPMLILDPGGVFGVRQAGAVMGPQAETPVMLEAEEEDEQDQEQGPRPTKVMVVDDSLSVRRVASRYLQSLNCDITTANDGIEALEKLRQEPVDIVFTDLEMPRLHGYGLLQEIKQQEALRHIPVVVVTSRSGEKHQDLAIEMGAAGYVTKPFSRDTLASHIAEHVKKSPSQVEP